MGAIPDTGIHGAALREAATTEMRQMIELVRAALARKLYPDGREAYVCVEAIYPDRVIAEREGRYWAYPYALAEDNTVTVGEPQEVVEQYVPVRMAEAVKSVFVEAVEGGRWLIRVIRAGLSLNQVFYPDAVLREAVPLFEGARVFIKSDAEHIQGGGKDVRNLVGRLVEAKFVAGAMPDCGEVRACLELIQPQGAVAVQLREAHERGMSGLFGFSIDADGTAKATLREGKRVRVAQSISRVSSVDLIVEPGAGGQLIRLVEAVHTQTQSEDAMRQRMIEAVKAKHGGALPAGLNPDDDAALEAAYREAIAPAPQPQPNTADIAEQIRMVEARATARERINASTLPQMAKDKLLADFAGRARFVEADVASAIEQERAYLARFVEAGHVTGLGEGRVEAGQDRADKIVTMWDDFFDRTKPPTISLREAYIETTGDRGVTGLVRDSVRLREAAGARFREAVSASTFADILGDSITRAMVREYNNLEAYRDWRWLVDTVSIRDFRVNERTRMGGYGNLPAVAENGAYTALSTPADEKETYAISKRGGKETISLEVIANDDQGVIRRLPGKLATAAGRTLYEFVFDFLRTPPTLGDGVALFHASRGNLGSTALSSSSFAAARLAMKQRTELSSGKKLGVILKHLAVPAELEETAFDLFVRGTNNDETFVQSRKPTVHVVDYWTDASDWVATADRADVPLIEIGFYNGNEEPELFVQDMPTQGSLFNNDQITYKVRHIYGGNALDHVGFYKAVVA